MLTRNKAKLIGQHPGLCGDCSGLRGDCTGLRGDLDDCGLTEQDRTEGRNIETLVGEDNRKEKEGQDDGNCKR